MASVDDLLADLLGEDDVPGTDAKDLHTEVARQVGPVQGLGGQPSDTSKPANQQQDSHKVLLPPENLWDPVASTHGPPQSVPDAHAAPHTAHAHLPIANPSAAKPPSAPDLPDDGFGDFVSAFDEAGPSAGLAVGSTENGDATGTAAAGHNGTDTAGAALGSVGIARCSPSGLGGGEEGDDDDLLMLEGLDDVFESHVDLHTAEDMAPQPPMHLTPPDHASGVQAVFTSQQPQLEQLPQLPQQVSTSQQHQLEQLPQRLAPFAAAQLQLDSLSARPSGQLSTHSSRVPSVTSRMAPMHSLAMHRMLLEEAEATEESLLTGTCSGDSGLPADQLDELLAGARQDWPAQGRPDASGAMVGGSVALKLEEVVASVPELGAALGLGHQGGSTAGVRWHGPHVGVPRVVSLQGPVVAVGTSFGVVLVAQLPSIAAAAAAAASSVADGGEGRARLPNTAQQQQPGGAASSVAGALPPLLTLGEPRSDAEAVTSLGFSRVDSMAESLWLMVGHASGTVVVWDLQRRPARCVTTISGQHGLPVTHASFFPGHGVSLALTADRRGRLVAHTFSSNLLMRTAAQSRPLLDGSLGIISAIVHLTPFPATWGQAGGGGPQDGTRSGGSGAGGGSGGPAAPPATVGEGMAALCTPTGCHVARFRPNGDMILLMIIPRPESVRQGTLPAAAWGAHTHRNFAPTTLTATVAISGAAGPGAAAEVPESLTVPCASLAVAWGHMVMFCDVPLIGDHRPTASGAGADQTAIAAAAAAQAQAGQGVGRSLLRTVTNAAVTASRAVTAVETLTPPVVKQLALAFPVQVLRRWETSALDQQHVQGKGSAGQGASGTPGNVLALHWYDGDALGVVVHQDLQMRLAVVGPDLELREQVDCFDTPLASPHLTTTAPTRCCPESISGQGSRILLLGASGALYCSRLMGWQERLRTLQDVGKLRLALWYGLEFYKMHLARKHAAIASGHAPHAADVATAQHLASWLLGLLSTYAQEGLMSAVSAARQAGGWVTPEVQASCSRLARLSICLCLVLGQQLPLFQQLFAAFQQARLRLGQLPAQPPEAAAGKMAAGLVRCAPLSAFLAALEPHILADRLPSLAPEVVQALVEHFAGGSPPQPQRVERCVLHLDVFTLDLDQVLRLCSAHGLYSAMVYVYNRINEYRQPALEMLACIAGFRPLPQTQTPTGEASGVAGGSNTPGTRKHDACVTIARKLLVYLRCTFRGQAFPPGSGPLMQSAAAEGAGELRAQLLGLLLFTDLQDLAREWQQPVAAVERVVGDPYPALQLLLEADAAATVSVLGEAVDGWDAVETELRAAAGKPLVEEMDSVLVATQVLVNALVTLMDNASSKPAPAGPTPSPTSAISSASRTATLDFITSLVTARRVTVQPQFVLLLLQHVLQPPAGSGVLQLPTAQLWRASMDGSGAGAAGGGWDANRAAGAGRAWDSNNTGIADASGLARHGSISFSAGTAGAAGAAGVVGLQQLEVQPSGPAERLAMCLLDVVGVNAVRAIRQAPDKLSDRESGQAIQMLLRHGMRLAAAHVHHMRGEVAQALDMHLALKDTNAPFMYIYSCLHSGHASVRGSLMAAVLEAAPQLVACSAVATAAALLALGLAGDQLHLLLGRLEADPRAKFQLLRAIMALVERLARDARQQGEEEEGGDVPHAARTTRVPTTAQRSLEAHGPSGPSGPSDSPWGPEEDLRSPMADLLLPSGSPSVPRQSDPRLDGAACDAYVVLACRFSTASVLPFLLRHTAYDVRKCLQAVRETPAARGAHAYLLERLGDLPAAFQLHLSHIKESSIELAAAMEQQGQQRGEVLAVVHIVWLMSLPSRLRTTLPHICGEEAYQKALKLLETRQQVQQQQQRGQRGLPGIRVAAAGTPHSPAFPIAPKWGGPDLPAPPPELQTFWAALITACGFCQRVSRAEKLRDMLQAAARAAERAEGAAGGAAHDRGAGRSGGASSNSGKMGAHGASHLQREAHGTDTASVAGTGTVHVRAAAEDMQGQRQAQGAGQEGEELRRADSLPSGTAASYWLQLLEVYIQLMLGTQPAAAGRPTAIASSAQPAAAPPADALRHMFAAAVEEVVGGAADHVQLAELVRHISGEHGDAAVGEFRSLLSGLLSACSYEQAIMAAARRLMAHDALAHVRSRQIRLSRHLTSKEITATPAATQQPQQQGSGQQASGDSTSRSGLLLVSDVVHSGLLAEAGRGGAAGRDASRGRGTAATGAALVVLDASGAAAQGGSGAKEAIGMLNPVPEVELAAATTHGLGSAARRRAVLGGRAADFQLLGSQGRSCIRANVDLSSVRRSLGLSRSSRSQRPTGQADHHTRNGHVEKQPRDHMELEAPGTPDPVARPGPGGPQGATLQDAFDLDHLLTWAVDASSARA